MTYTPGSMLEVDVFTEASLSPYIRDRVLDEAVAL